MKGLSVSAIGLGVGAALLSPELLGKLTGTQVFYLLLIALVLALLAESVLKKKE